MMKKSVFESLELPHRLCSMAIGRTPSARLTSSSAKSATHSGTASPGLEA